MSDNTRYRISHVSVWHMDIQLRYGMIDQYLSIGFLSLKCSPVVIFIYTESFFYIKCLIAYGTFGTWIPRALNLLSKQ